MKKSTGRPLKYRNLIDSLDDTVIYSPASIVNHAVETGVIVWQDNALALRLERVRIRHTLARFAKNHHFPVEGDGDVALPGQALSRGWRGLRWKNAMPIENPSRRIRARKNKVESDPPETS